MRKLLLAVALFVCACSQGATLQSVNSTNELVLLSPYTISTNTFVVTEGTVADGTASIWTFVKGDATGPDTNHLDSVVAPGVGRWVRNMISGHTNFFTINPTDGYLPYRSNATTFGDSPWYYGTTNTLGFVTTERFLHYHKDGAWPNDSTLSIGVGALAGTGTSTGADARTVAIGERAIDTATINSGTTAVGWEAGAYATNLTGSVAIGSGAGTPEDGINLVSVGTGAGPGYTHSYNDTFIGTSAGASVGVGPVTVSSSNTVVGAYTSYAATGTDMTSIGAWAGSVNQGMLGIRDRSYGTFLGSWAGYNKTTDLTITNAIAIGFSTPVTNSNEIIIGNEYNTKLIVPITSWTGTGTNYLSDDGTYKAGTGLGTTINPTLNYLPFKNGASSFGDSWLAVDSDDIDFNGTNITHYLNIQNSTNLLTLGIAGAGALVQGGNVLNVLNNVARGISISTNYVVPSDDGQLDLGGPSAHWNNFYLTNQIIFGPGTTNVLYRSGGHLFYTNGSVNVDVKVENGSGRIGAFGLNTGNQVEVRAEGAANAVTLNNSSDQVTLFGGGLYPATATINLGGDGSEWNDLWLQNVGYIVGFVSGANYSRNQISHSGTNGFALYNSTANGIAGTGRPHQFQIGGTNVFRINYENWVDSMVPATAVRVGATAPTFDAFAGTPVYVYLFSNSQDDEVHFQAQLNHNFKQGTDISPHVHWAETAATGAGTNVVWELISGWANVNAQFSSWSTNYITNSITGTTNYHQLGEFPHLTGTSKNVSSVIACRLRRVSTVSASDDYDQNVAFLGFDFHYLADSPGSDGEASKSF